MHHYVANAGSASSLFGTLMYSCGALAAAGVSRFANGTVLPMAGLIAACATLAVLFYFGMAVRAKTVAISLLPKQDSTS